MSFTIAELADALGLRAEGDLSVTISAVAEPAQAGAGDLALAMKPDFAAQLSDGQAVAAMMWTDADWASFGLKAALLAPRPRYAMAGLSVMMDAGPGYPTGIHPSAVIHPEAMIGDIVTVGPLSVIEAGARIGSGSVIGPSCYIGSSATLGANAILHT